MVPEILAVDNNFFGVLGVAAVLVDFGVLYVSICRVPSWLWTVASRKAILV